MTLTKQQLKQIYREALADALADAVAPEPPPLSAAEIARRAANTKRLAAMLSARRADAAKASPIAWALTSAMLTRVMDWLDGGPALAYRGGSASLDGRREWDLADVPAPPAGLDWLVCNLQAIPECGLIALGLQYVGPSPAPQAPPKVILKLGEETAELYKQNYLPGTKRLSLEYLGELAANDFALRMEVPRSGEILVRIEPGSGETTGDHELE